ncbi:hypothetical protein [Micromonospora andamanensis]|uniref:hypothetical protein n=1 Tax=Micromonospora andamanensis TaxID=1287068 RepID=UPI00194F370C|nr:hypothetical protein [Micromonospora andamanensis]
MTRSSTPSGPVESSEPTTTDRVRAACMAAAAGLMVLVPTLGPVIAGTEEGADEFDTEITPPDYAFAIWAPIFAGVAANAIQHAVRPATVVNRRTGWWLTAAYGANTAWSVAAQANRFQYTPYILPLAAAFAGTAHRRAQAGRPHGPERLVAPSSGLLFGWTSVASVVNVFATRRRGRFTPTTRSGRTAARLAVVGAAAALGTTIATSRRGYTPIAVAGGWALATSAANRERPVQTRVFNATGAALIVGTTAIRLWTDRRRGHRA